MSDDVESEVANEEPVRRAAPGHRPQSWFKKNILGFWKKVPKFVKIILLMLGSFLFSQRLQSLSETELWFPLDLRHIVELMSVLVASLGGFLADLYFNKHFKKKERDLVGRRRAVFCAVFLLSGIAVFFYSYQLRTTFLYSFNQPEEWWIQQYGAPADSKGETSRANGSVLEKAVQEKIPDFINRERNVIFIPPILDDDMRSYLKSVGDGDLSAGINTILVREPDRLISWELGKGRSSRIHKGLHFLLVHLILMACFGAMWGLFPAKEDWIHEELIGHAVHALPQSH